MIGLLGKKIGMTTIFAEDGRRVPVTVVSAGPCVVVQVKTPDKDGYSAIQLGYDPVKAKRVTKPLQGHFKKAGLQPYRRLKEFTTEDIETEFQVGQELKIADIFAEGELIDCIGTSKGKGFQGAVKLHHFGGGPRTHGQSDRTRAPGSVGASSYPSRLVKGIRMAAHMGNDTVTIRGLRIEKILGEDNLMLIKGSIAGPKGGYVILRRSMKMA